MATHRQVFFLGTGSRQRFCVATRPAGPSRGAILHVHAFAEELNRSRPMCAVAAQAFAEAGWLVLQIDGHGCGDSLGESGDATWDSWLDDLDQARAWLQAQGHDRATLWTLRGGSLLAASWLQHRGLDWPLLLWQPMASGKQLLTQFLRLRLVDDGGPEGKHIMTQLRQSLAEGRSVDIAGYVISAVLAAGLEAASLDALKTGQAPLALIEVGGATGTALSPASETQLARWREAGRRCDATVVSGPKFWQSYDTRMAPDLVPASLRLLEALA